MNNFNEITNEKIYTRLNAKKFYLKYENCDMPLEDILFQLQNICLIDKYIIVKDTIFEGSNNIHVYIKTYNKPNIKSLSYFDLIKKMSMSISIIIKMKHFIIMEITKFVKMNNAFYILQI